MVSIVNYTIGASRAAKSFRLLLCHASGFCKEMWAPVSEDLGKLLAQKNITAEVVALDFSGHGDSRANPTPAVWPSFLPFDIYEAVEKGFSTKGELVGVGHSMGGAGLCMAQIGRPGLFSQLVLCEPIIPNSHGDPDTLAAFRAGGTMLSATAAKRRSHWPNRADASQFFHTRGVMRSWDKRAIDSYVAGAIRDSPDGCVLKCAPAVEAQLYHSPHDIFDQLNQISRPTLVLAGEDTNTFTNDYYGQLAAAMPAGKFKIMPGSHFFPMEHPGLVAAEIAGVLQLPAHL